MNTNPNFYWLFLHILNLQINTLSLSFYTSVYCNNRITIHIFNTIYIIINYERMPQSVVCTLVIT